MKKEYNKLRFSSDLDLSLDTLIKFQELTIKINCVIEKNDEYYPEIYLDECLYVNNDYLKEYKLKKTNSKNVYYKMTQLGIKNKLFSYPSKLNNIIDINLDKISVKDILSSNDLSIYYIKYDGNNFYLVIVNIKGYFETNNNNINYLTIIFDNEKYEKIFKGIWDKIK